MGKGRGKESGKWVTKRYKSGGFEVSEKRWVPDNEIGFVEVVGLFFLIVIGYWIYQFHHWLAG